ncbi:unnamed protein product [Durusdinium trenchii]|uniref:Uncharacterized protein n=1 Tax=Durusdinium trenchii TaxID=1381693 RepID=A0ABP0JNE7_9DINO
MVVRWPLPWVMRRCVPSMICGADFLNLFAHSTTKYINIRETRFGLPHYGLMFLIAMYLLVYQLIGKLGYLKFNDAPNTVRFTLQEPTGCNPDTGCHQDNFASLSQLCHHRSFSDNCTDSSRESSGAFIPEILSDIEHQSLSICFNSYYSAASNCDDHSVTSPKSGLATTSQMQGMLFDNGNDGDKEGGSSTDNSPCSVLPNEDGLDYFSMGTVLQDIRALISFGLGALLCGWARLQELNSRDHIDPLERVQLFVYMM